MKIEKEKFLLKKYFELMKYEINNEAKKGKKKNKNMFCFTN